MVVRRATRADAETIERIRIRGWQAGYSHVFPAEKLRRLEPDSSRWEERLVRPPSGWATYVAQARGRVLGFVSIGPSRDDVELGEIYAIYVDPDEWSRGTGRALLARGEERLAEEYDEASLWVLEDNPRARRFYEAAGWRVDGEPKLVRYLELEVPSVRYRKRLRPSGS
jgi:ribosomal protein S18 acetylase RimI-like enzyme